MTDYGTIIKDFDHASRQWADRMTAPGKSPCFPAVFFIEWENSFAHVRKSMDYEVIIIGAGPAGIFSALTLLGEGVGPVLLLEQGKAIHERVSSPFRDILCGWGGAGAYSDGKLTFSTEVGGYLGE